MADVSHVVGKPPVQILSMEQELNPEGDFKFGYKSEDGTSVGAERLVDGESHGSYSYDTPDGPIEITWTAGKDGYQAFGPSIPAVPKSVIDALEYIKAHPYKEEPEN